MATESLTLRQFVDKVVDELLAKYNVTGVQRDLFLEKMHSMVHPIVEFTACFNLVFPGEAVQTAVAHDFLACLHAQASALISMRTDARYSREVQDMIAGVQREYDARMAPITLVHDPAAFQRAINEADSHP